MSDATEGLHRLLDERGVEYRFNESTKVFEWHFEGTDGKGSAHATEVHGGINIIACSLTPEQAIVATLGRGTCRLVETEHEQEIFDGGYYTYWSYDCDECGHENTEYGRFCAGCGAKVVGE